MPETVWGSFPEWRWSYEEDLGAGDTESLVRITGDKIAWKYTEDRWGRSGEQSFPDFFQFGPLWSVPQELVRELVKHFGVKEDVPWMAPGYKDYSVAWWAVDRQTPGVADMVTPADAGRRYHGQRTLLMQAAQKSLVPVVERLLALGADARAADEEGRTALLEASWQLPPSLPILKLLLDHGAEINARNKLGRTALLEFCSTANPDPAALQFLIDHGADVNHGDVEGRTSRWSVAQRRYLPPELMQILLAAGAR